MPTERFSLSEFEHALPLAGWNRLGLVGGEHCYVIPIRHPKFLERETDVEIYIRSSVDASGYAADTGNDSIRVTLVDAIERKPLATKDAKPQRWVARTANWRENLLKLLRWNFKVGCLLGTCPKCKRGDVKLSRVNNPAKKSNGALYASCWSHCGYFLWVNEETGEPSDHAVVPQKDDQCRPKKPRRSTRAKSSTESSTTSTNV